MARFCEKCKTGTSSRMHRTKCLKRATSGNLDDALAATSAMILRMSESIIRLEQTVALLTQSMCHETRRNAVLHRMKPRPQASEEPKK